MKRKLTIAVMLVCTLMMMAQSISVSNFKLLETDLTAITAGTMERDQNGEAAAIIKVVTTQTGFSFDGGAIGIVKTVQKPGEIWVYVPRGLKKISIFHPQLGILRDYYLPISVASARTYEMNLVSGTFDTSILGEADINSLPAMADIYIDGQKVGQTPQLVSNLHVGQHKLRISKKGYKDYDAKLTVREKESVMIFAKLKEIVAVQEEGTLDRSTSKDSIQTITIGNISFNMIRVDGGTFTMGATNEQVSDAGSSEKPVHQVTLLPYYIGETEVTQALWEKVMGSNPSNLKGSNLPVEQVSWYDCQEFILKLNKKTGQEFRLPTEAEWEFAARGGNKSQGYIYSGSNNVGKVAWYYDNMKNQTHNIKTKKANELGLYDMSGNVWEWCLDWYGDYPSSAQTNPTGPSSGSLRVFRGGCWHSHAWGCRVSLRGKHKQSYRFYDLGLRLAL